MLSDGSIIQNTGFKLFVDGLDVNSGGTQWSAIPTMRSKSLAFLFNHLRICSRSCFDILNSKYERNIDDKQPYT